MILAEPSIVPVWFTLIALFGAGAVFALVSSIVYAIKQDRPGMIALGLGSIFCLFVIGSGLIWVVRSAAVPGNWQVHAGDFSVSGQSIAETVPHLNLGMIKGTGILVFVLLGFLVMRLFRGGERRPGRGSWGGTALIILLMVFIGARLLPATSRNAEHAREIAEASRSQAAEMQREVARAQQEIRTAQQKVSTEPKASANVAADSMSDPLAAASSQKFHELWLKITEPRINLRSEGNTVIVDSHGQSMTAGASSDASQTATASIDNGESTERSIAQSLARLEQLARQISTVARDVSEVAAVVAKATIVQQEGSSNRTAQITVIPGPPNPPAPVVVMHAPVVPATVVSAPQPLEKPHAKSKKGLASAPVKTVDEAAVVIEPVAATSNGKPAWLNQPTNHVGNVWRQVLATDEYATDDECEKQMDEQLKSVTADYIKRFVGAQGKGALGGASVPDPEAMGIGIDYIRREIAKEQFVETNERSVGPMKKLYTRVEFTPGVNEELRQQWNAYRRQSRFSMVGMGAASILGFLGMTLGLLKVDTATKGYYTKRLFIGVPAAIIGLATLIGYTISVIG